MENPENVGVTGCRWLLESQNLDSRLVMDKSPGMCELWDKIAPWEAWIPKMSRSGWSPPARRWATSLLLPLIVDYILDTRTHILYTSFSGLLLFCFVRLSHKFLDVSDDLRVKEVVQGFVRGHIAGMLLLGGFRHDRLRESLLSD